MKMGLAFRWPRRTAALRRGQNAAVRMVSDPVSVLCSQPARLSVTDSLPCVRSSLKGLFSTLRFKRAQDAPPPPAPRAPGSRVWPRLLLLARSSHTESCYLWCPRGSAISACGTSRWHRAPRPVAWSPPGDAGLVFARGPWDTVVLLPQLLSLLPVARPRELQLLQRVRSGGTTL